MNVHTLSRSQPIMSIDEFLDWTETKQDRYELVDGVPKLLPWVKRNHNRIVVNFVKLLGDAIDPETFEIATGDFAIPTGPTSIRFADVFVEAAGQSGQERGTNHAILIIEVLSPSTTPEDFGAKQREYLGLPTLDTYLIAAQDSRCLWQWTRNTDGEWPDAPLLVTEGDVTVEKLGAVLPLDDIYRGVS